MLPLKLGEAISIGGNRRKEEPVMEDADHAVTASTGRGTGEEWKDISSVEAGTNCIFGRAVLIGY